MTLDQLLTTILVALLTTVVAVVVAGLVIFYLILRKVKTAAARSRQGLPLDTVASHNTLVQVQKVAWLMDSSIPIGGGHRIGIDGLIDFVPGLGDFAGVLVSGWIIYRAAASGVPQALLMRMAGNVLIDALLGAFPVLGVIADSAFKANLRNVQLFEDFLNKQNLASKPNARVIDVEPLSSDTKSR